MKTTQATTNAARLNPGRQWVGINNIILNERFQPRHKTDFKWMSELTAFRKDGSEFPPVRVYQLPDGRLVAASGHHRIPAMQHAGEEQVLCDIVDGTEEDAIVFAAGSNKGNGVKPMGPKDITKAVEMLLAIDAWWTKASDPIADHVGCSSSKVSKIRARLSAETGKPLPIEVKRRDGKSVPYRPAKGNERRRIGSDSRGRRYATYRGKVILGKNDDEVRAKLALAMRAASHERMSIEHKSLWSRFGTLGFTTVFSKSVCNGMRTLGRPGIIAVGCDISSVRDITEAIGQLIAARRYKGDLTVRMIVLCYPEGGPAKLIDLYKQEGFEFLTPEELAEALK